MSNWKQKCLYTCYSVAQIKITGPKDNIEFQLCWTNDIDVTWLFIVRLFVWIGRTMLCCNTLSQLVLQWVVLTRKHALVVLKDEDIFPMFRQHCKAGHLLIYSVTYNKSLMSCINFIVWCKFCYLILHCCWLNWKMPLTTFCFFIDMNPKKGGTQVRTHTS